MAKVSINDLVAGLKEVPDEKFRCEPIYDFLLKHPVNPSTIQNYLHWSENFYTRNLIYKDERFELMAICWERGQVSRVHNHAEQRCWMTVPIGKLQGINFSVVEIDGERGFCRLSESERFEMTDIVPAKVELEEPIHQILNLDEFDQRAVSLHVYSKPYDKCISYCLETDSFKEVNLAYTSINGELCDGVVL